MNKKEKVREAAKKVYQLMCRVFIICGILACLLIYLMVDPNLATFKSSFAGDYTPVLAADGAVPNVLDDNKIENGIHVRTGFVEGEGLMAVVNNCTNCHSAKLVTQNRMSREKWLATIRWMQETQNLWDLGNDEEVIVNYLAKYYAPIAKGRRQNLTNIDWYELDN